MRLDDPSVRRYLVRLSVVMLCLVLVGLTTYSAGESRRRDAAISRAVAAESMRTDRLIRQLERQIRADCRFKRSIATLPEVSIRLGQPVTPVIADVAAGARVAYIGNLCPQAGFGPPPPVFTASPPLR